MDYQLNTRLNGNIAMTSSYHERASLQRDKTLYKFIWVSKILMNYMENIRQEQIWSPKVL